MASKSQVTIGNRLFSLIKQEGTINKFDLMDKAGIGISQYNMISAWFKHRYEEELKQIEYVKASKCWVYRGVENV